MVQLYGTVKTMNGDDLIVDEREGTQSEGSALLQGNASARPREGHASITSCVSNLSNTIIGSGKYACSSKGQYN